VNDQESPLSLEDAKALESALNMGLPKWKGAALYHHTPDGHEVYLYDRRGELMGWYPAGPETDYRDACTGHFLRALGNLGHNIDLYYASAESRWGFDTKGDGRGHHFNRELLPLLAAALIEYGKAHVKTGDQQP
jgi:hypothetical protein